MNIDSLIITLVVSSLPLERFATFKSDVVPHNCCHVLLNPVNKTFKCIKVDSSSILTIPTYFIIFV